MSKKRYVSFKLNGKYFELDTKEKTTEFGISRRNIFDCYSRPSSYKASIYQDWLTWFIDNDGYCGIGSYNCMMFTIQGYVTDKETGKRYYCYITKAHNKCIEVA